MKQFLLPVVCLAFLALCHSVQAQAGQLVEQDDVQSWNDLQVTVPLSKKLDVFGQATFRFGQDISRVNDRRLAFGFVWKPHKLLSVSPFYWNITMRNSRGLVPPGTTPQSTYNLPLSVQKQDFRVVAPQLA